MVLQEEVPVVPKSNRERLHPFGLLVINPAADLQLCADSDNPLSLCASSCAQRTTDLHWSHTCGKIPFTSDCSHRVTNHLFFTWDTSQCSLYFSFYWFCRSSSESFKEISFLLQMELLPKKNLFLEPKWWSTRCHLIIERTSVACLMLWIQ